MTKKIQIAIGKIQVLKFHNPVIENISHLLAHEMDLMSISKSGMMCEFEVKISRSDFKADSKKRKWYWFEEPHVNYCPNYFSYVCPKDLIKIDEVQDYAGLYYYEEDEIIEIKKPKRLHKEIYDRNRIIEKVNRLNSERQFLGCARLTYENNLIKENNRYHGDRKSTERQP